MRTTSTRCGMRHQFNGSDGGMSKTFFNEKNVLKILLGEEEAHWDDLHQVEIQQLVEEVQDVAEHVDAMNFSVENAVKQLRAAADFLDQVWKDCKIASAVGSGANITGGVLAVLGGVATIMTAGAATPLLIAGTAFGVAGTCTNMGTSAVETSVNQSVIQEAEGAVQNANRAIENVRKRLRDAENWKESSSPCVSCWSCHQNAW